ncbi:MAG TPA: DNA-processing protein DprA [Polyangia bacterium]|nr:DNA-processing protein DprA [Polyangia bacterium]
MATLIDTEARAIYRGQAGYPARLAALGDGPDPLWMAGRWSPSERAVAVVGARAAGARALELGHAIGRALAEAGVDVISGGALGLDQSAHRGALDGGGATVAVLGTGIDVVYPLKHLGLYQEIIATRGALLTQFPPGMQPNKGTFPTRNKIIAALADVVVVVEASVVSGTLHTVRAAQVLGRALAAVPGSPGTDAMIVEGAAAVASPEDVVALAFGRPLAPLAAPGDPDAARLYAALDRTPRDVGDLAFRAGLAIGTCAAMVLDLELGGLAARAAGGRYIRLR